MNDGSTSYFHQSIGGYHAAKMMRYQELFEYQIAKNNMQVLNMLNTKYFIVDNDKGEKQAQQNPDANGNAWFINKLVKRLPHLCYWSLELKRNQQKLRLLHPVLLR